MSKNVSPFLDPKRKVVVNVKTSNPACVPVPSVLEQRRKSYVCPGIYMKHEDGDSAFQRIHFNQLHTVVQSGSIPNDSSSGSSSVHQFTKGKDRIASLVKALQRQKRQQRAKSGLVKLSSKAKPASPTKEPEPEDSTLGTRYDRSLLSTLAKDDKHARYMQRTVEKLAVEVPMPIKIILFEEAYPIIKDTAQAYIRVLGKHHPLTRQAHERVAHFKVFEEVLPSM